MHSNQTGSIQLASELSFPEACSSLWRLAQKEVRTKNDQWEKVRLGYRLRRSSILSERIKVPMATILAWHLLEQTSGAWDAGHLELFFFKKKRKGKMRFCRKWLVCCSFSVLGLAEPHFPPAWTSDSGKSYRMGLGIQLPPKHTCFSTESAKSAEQASLGQA